MARAVCFRANVGDNRDETPKPPIVGGIGRVSITREMSMSTEENKAIVRRFGQVWGKGSLAAIDEFADPNLSVYYPVLKEPIRGPEGFKQYLMEFQIAFPDVEVIFDDVIAEDDKVV